MYYNNYGFDITWIVLFFQFFPDIKNDFKKDFKMNRNSIRKNR